MAATTIPVQDLTRHYEPMADALKQTALKVLDSGWYILGREVKAFEQEFASYLGAKECVGVANGTDALELALRLFEVGPGDEVCTVANAGMYSTTAILNTGAKPVFVDVEPATLTMSPGDLAARITPATKAVIVTHLYGGMADMDGVLASARSRSLRVIEDCAQAHGAKRGDRTAGTCGEVGCFSFYPTKNLGALGDGGALCVHERALAERLRALRQYGWTSRYHSTMRGGRNSRLDELQAAFLREQLPRLDGWNQRRRQIARLYSESFRGTELRLPSGDGDAHVFHLYVVRVAERDRFRRLLGESGVGSDIHYPVADYAQESVRAQLGLTSGLDETEKACSEAVTLPCFPEMTDTEVGEVITRVLSALKTLRP